MCIVVAGLIFVLYCLGKEFVRIQYVEDQIKRVVRRQADIRIAGANCSFSSLKIGDHVDALWASTGRYYPAIVIGPCEYINL